MFIVMNDQGLAWQGGSWGWTDAKRFVSVGSATRAIQEAGEDLDYVAIIEDPFTVEDYALLIGSVGLFVILGMVMYLTRRIDWYGSGPGSRVPPIPPPPPPPLSFDA